MVSCGFNNENLIEMKIQIENLRAQMRGVQLNGYQRALALDEYYKLLDYVEELEKLTIPAVMESVCSCSKGKGIDHDEDGKAYCIDCGGVLGRDCWNEQDCVQISQSQNNQDQQFINQLLSELHWERDVVVPDLEQKLSSALTAMYDLASMLNKLEISQNEAEHVEKALQFYNENRHYKKPVVTTSNTNDDGLPF